MSRTQTFVDLCLAGNVLLEEIDDFIDQWHASSAEIELHEYLGMTKEEYALWLRVPDVLPYVIKARHDSKTLTDAVMHACQDMRLAARSSDQSKIALLRRWLEAKGKVH